MIKLCLVCLPPARVKKSCLCVGMKQGECGWLSQPLFCESMEIEHLIKCTCLITSRAKQNTTRVLYLDFQYSNLSICGPAGNNVYYSI